MKQFHTNIIVGLLLASGVVLAISSMRHTSPACDEVSHHIATGYSFLKTRDFRLNSTSPPLTEELAAIPLLFLRPHLPIEDPSWNRVDRVTFGFQFLYRYNNNADELVFFSRIPMVLLAALGGLVLFCFARELYGVKAGLFALFLYSFSPHIIAHAGLVTPDIGATSFILLALYRFYKFLLKPKTKNVVFAGIALGLAVTTKYSALVLIPLFIGLALFKALKEKKLRYAIGILAIMVICAAVIFTVYLGEVKPLLENDIDVPEKISYFERAVDKVIPGDNQRIKTKIVDLALNAPMPLATYIMNILAETNMVFVKPYPTFLMGRYSTSGWWYYYLAVFLFKTSIILLCLILIAAIKFRSVKPRHVWGEIVGLAFIAVFTAATFFSRLQLGLRYILPLYPLFFLYISKLINLKIKKQYLLRVILIICCLWYLIEAVIMWPDYLAYFNQFAGGPDKGWRYLRDSNIDYGQDLPALAAYLRRNNISNIKLLYCGTANPAYYGIRYSSIGESDKETPQQAVYAISVNYIDAVAWTKNIDPTFKAGYSIFIYDFRR